MRPFHIVDVFTDRRYAGNPLAVVLEAGDLTADEMQAIAREIHFSETTFVCSTEPVAGTWPVRIFTPEKELPFAGHPTLGTAAVIAQVYGTGPEVTLALGVGSVPVQQDDAGAWWMTQPVPTFGDTVDPATVAQVLGVAEGDLRADLSAQVVSTGLPFLIVPVQTVETVQNLDLRRMDRALQVDVAARTGATGVLAFACGALEPAHHLHARVFVDSVGVPEDPATGSACGCLAAYVAKHRVLGEGPVRAVVEQGYEIGRPSQLSIAVDTTHQGGLRVRVGGQVVPVAFGTWITANG